MKYLILLLYSIFINASLNGQSKSLNSIRIVFYNVENLFDTFDDPACIDEDFTPNSELQWNEEKYNHKLNQLARVFLTLGQDQLPDIIGLAEVENKKVLDELLVKTGLKDKGYSIIHINSPDKRGIDVALLYRKNRFTPEKWHNSPVLLGSGERPTRDILYVKGVLPNKQVIHLLVNHWPSRSGGVSATLPKRMVAAKAARRLADSLFVNDRSVNLILMGDFNDYPSDSSLVFGLKAKSDTVKPADKSLVNLMAWQESVSLGSHCYKGKWGFLDQFIVSGNLLNDKNLVHLHASSAKVVQFPFLFKKGSKEDGKQGIPFRTYQGKKYLGGYSDHLPIVLDLTLKNASK